MMVEIFIPPQINSGPLKFWHEFQMPSKVFKALAREGIDFINPIQLIPIVHTNLYCKSMSTLLSIVVKRNWATIFRL